MRLGDTFLIVGRAGMDIYPHPPGTKIEDAQQCSVCLGGSSANIGVALCKLGCHCSLVTRISDDAIGNFVMKQLQHYGVDTRYIRVHAQQCRTSLAVVESRVKQHQSVIYRNNAADLHTSVHDIQAIDFSHFDSMVITGTVFASSPSREAGFCAISQAKAHKLPCIVDLDYRPYSWVSASDAAQTYQKIAKECDIVVGNDDEFGVIAQDYHKGLSCARSLAVMGKTIMYKMGEKGAIVMHQGQEWQSGVFPSTVLKPTGAGDSFLGGLLAGLSKGKDIATAVRQGSACAAMVVSRIGCAPAMPTNQELKDFLAKHANI